MAAGLCSRFERRFLRLAICQRSRQTASSSRMVISGVNQCPNNCLCSNEVEVDHKDQELLSQLVSRKTGKLLPNALNGLCREKHLEVSKAIYLRTTMGMTVLYQENGINDCPTDCLCSNDIELDYKNPQLLSQFVSSKTGMILPRTVTGICMKKQRQLAKAIKASRHAGFLPYVRKAPEYMADPVLFRKAAVKR